MNENYKIVKVNFQNLNAHHCFINNQTFWETNHLIYQFYNYRITDISSQGVQTVHIQAESKVQCSLAMTKAESIQKRSHLVW